MHHPERAAHASSRFFSTGHATVVRRIGMERPSRTNRFPRIVIFPRIVARKQQSRETLWLTSLRILIYDILILGSARLRWIILSVKRNEWGFRFCWFSIVCIYLFKTFYYLSISLEYLFIWYSFFFHFLRTFFQNSTNRFSFVEDDIEHINLRKNCISLSIIFLFLV